MKQKYGVYRNFEWNASRTRTKVDRLSRPRDVILIKNKEGTKKRVTFKKNCERNK